ncbi:MAG: NTP transferase domain-containing protein [Candidatus Altiarchaeota archaeon]|nr:NTP transferase domain-containing protein [Candidatus Altiarchaeota archaeon]
MRAVILSGGKSSRFWPLNAGHKSLMEITGKPLIIRTINNLPKEISEVIIVEPPGGVISEVVKKHPVNRHVEFRTQDKPKGMWDAILVGSEDYGDDVLIVSGHQFSPFAFENLIAGRGTKLLLSHSNNPSEYGVAEVDGDNVVGIEEKPKKPKSDLIINSIYRLSQDFVKYLASHNTGEEYAFEAALSGFLKKKTVKFSIIPKEEIPSLKYPWDSLSVMERLLDEVSHKIKGEVSKDVIIEGDVFVDSGAQIMSGAKIYGPTYIGKGVVVGTNSLIRQSSIEMGAVIGYGSEVVRSLVGPSSKMHHSYVGDSVLGSNTWLGYGTVTANRRFDKKQIKSIVKRKKVNTHRDRLGFVAGNNSKIGISSQIMPGILIGADAIIGPSTLVDENVADGKMVYVKQKKVVK